MIKEDDVVMYNGTYRLVGEVTSDGMVAFKDLKEGNKHEWVMAQSVKELTDEDYLDLFDTYNNKLVQFSYMYIFPFLKVLYLYNYLQL